MRCFIVPDQRQPKERPGRGIAGPTSAGGSGRGSAPAMHRGRCNTKTLTRAKRFPEPEGPAAAFVRVRINERWLQTSDQTLLVPQPVCQQYGHGTGSCLEVRQSIGGRLYSGECRPPSMLSRLRHKKDAGSGGEDSVHNATEPETGRFPRGTRKRSARSDNLIGCHLIGVLLHN
jgi:hypothetical protein